MKSARWLGLALSGALASTPGQAGVNQWTQLGPEGGSFCSVVSAPSNPSVLYLDWLFRSSDGGATWEAPASPAGFRSCLLSVDVADPRRVYALSFGGFHRSDDAGDSWTRMGTGLPEYLQARGPIGVVPQNPSLLFLPHAFGGLYRSQNSGESWQEVSGSPLESFMWVAADPIVAGRIVAVTNSNGLLISTDSGSTWAQRRGDLPEETYSNALYFDPQRRDRYFLYTDSGLFRTLDAGFHWTNVLEVPDFNHQIASVAVLPDATLLVSQNGADAMRLVRSRDAGDHWNELPPPFPLHPEIGLLGLQATPDAVLSASGAGLFESRDEGGTWKALHDGLFATWVTELALDRSDPARIYGHVDSVLRPPGVIRSASEEPGWIHLSAPLNGSVEDIEVDPSDSKRVFVLVSLFVVRGGEVLRSDDAGSSWIARTTPDACLAPSDLAIDWFDAGRLYLAGSLYSPHCVPSCFNLRSDDEGRTWQCLGVLPAGFFPARLFPSPFHRGVLLAIADGGIHRSSDHGDHWEEVALPPEVPGAPPGNSTWFRDVEWVTETTVYAANGCAGLFVSHDAGQTWDAIEGSTSLFPSLNEVASSAFEPDSVFAIASPECGASTPSRMIHSSDGGATWELIEEGLRDWDLFDLIVDPVTPNRILVSAAGGGVLEFELRQPGTCVPDATTLCLNGGRFRIQSRWRDFAGGTGTGHGDSLSDESGSFWFFDEDNLELFVKELDGGATNGAWWTFYGALSNAEFSLLVTDAETGAKKGYFNPRARFASVGDIETFPQDPDTSASVPMKSGQPPTNGMSELAPAGACAPSSTTLCLQLERFAVSVEWTDFEGESGVGYAIPMTPDTGSFWFFEEGIHELAVKVIDGLGTNGSFWVYYASLSNVEFDLTVSDSVTGRIWRRHNPAGTFASGGDIEAFPQLP